ncbi:fructokinase [Streptomyces diastaticus subsp. diastaticus]|uniref:Fructokinase n=3 Tax=Streptomyces TaxID=1883 RepID=A0A380P4B5_STRGR|nr:MULTISPECIES: carbohydrate kinase [Streptomyces]NEE24911.1 carbohydrate kinase [Streptomyces sp. SID7982]QNE83882.1 carbohydrate kinase [Streptomyces rutgersensis]SUP60041.1 Fructokinase [Streptomyces griseus]GFH73749.1 fructokinase [Streptomyces diastaticus subsp. diastaticus]GGU07475.1 fructokinase [Streptomyces diastaticus subsp. diastaticus]
MIVVAGEALIDLVPRVRGDALTPLRPVRGGGPYNTAVALARLGGAAAFCSRVSTDAFGASLLERLTEEGVGTGLVQRGPEPTTLAVAAVGADGSASYAFYTGGTADRLFTLPPALPERTRAVSFGTCSLVLEPGAGAYEELMRREAGRGVFVALDPNIRAELVPDADAYRARFRTWLPHVSLLKLSEEDAGWLGLGLPELASAGPAAVVLTRGGAGLTVRTRDGAEYAVDAEKVEVADTIGAGDTVNAALLHALADRDLLRPGALAGLGADGWTRILTFASRAAAVTCSRAGAEPPYAWEVAEFASR